MAESNPFQLTPEDHVNFYLAHPDDEVMVVRAITSCVGLLRQGKLAGVKVMVATDGEATTIDYTGKGTAGRKLEVVNSLTYLGIPTEHISQPGLPDLHLTADHAELNTTVKEFSQDSTVAITLGKDGGVGAHPDHKAVHQAVLQSGQQMRVFGLDHETGHIKLTANDPSDRLQVLSFHPSQFQVAQGQHAGWQQIGKFAVGPETMKVLHEYSAFLLDGPETYDQY